VDEKHSAADDSLSAISFIVLHAALELRGFDSNLDEVEKISDPLQHLLLEI